MVLWFYVWVTICLVCQLQNKQLPYILFYYFLFYSITWYWIIAYIILYPFLRIMPLLFIYFIPFQYIPYPFLSSIPSHPIISNSDNITNSFNGFKSPKAHFTRSQIEVIRTAPWIRIFSGWKNWGIKQPSLWLGYNQCFGYLICPTCKQKLM